MGEPAGAWVDADLGAFHGCAADAAGMVTCWGCLDPAFDFGQCEPPADPMLSISSGYSHACGVGVDGEVVCWGRDDDGQSSP